MIQNTQLKYLAEKSTEVKQNADTCMVHKITVETVHQSGNQPSTKISQPGLHKTQDEKLPWVDQDKQSSDDTSSGRNQRTKFSARGKRAVPRGYSHSAFQEQRPQSAEPVSAHYYNHDQQGSRTYHRETGNRFRECSMDRSDRGGNDYRNYRPHKNRAYQGKGCSKSTENLNFQHASHNRSHKNDHRQNTNTQMENYEPHQSMCYKYEGRHQYDTQRCSENFNFPQASYNMWHPNQGYKNRGSNQQESNRPHKDVHHQYEGRQQYRAHFQQDSYNRAHPNDYRYRRNWQQWNDGHYQYEEGWQHGTQDYGKMFNFQQERFKSQHQNEACKDKGNWQIRNEGTSQTVRNQKQEHSQASGGRPHQLIHPTRGNHQRRGDEFSVHNILGQNEETCHRRGEGAVSQQVDSNNGARVPPSYHKPYNPYTGQCATRPHNLTPQEWTKRAGPSQEYAKNHHQPSPRVPHMQGNCRQQIQQQNKFHHSAGGEENYHLRENVNSLKGNKSYAEFKHKDIQKRKTSEQSDSESNDDNEIIGREGVEVTTLIDHKEGEEKNMVVKSDQLSNKPSIKCTSKPVAEESVDQGTKVNAKKLYEKSHKLINELTLQNIDTLRFKVQSLHIDSIEMSSIIELIHEKAVENPSYCAAYAQLCLMWATQKSTDQSIPENGQQHYTSFCKMLNARCWTEFENSFIDENERKMGLKLSVSNSEDDGRLRMRCIANMAWIGELYMVRLIKVGVLHYYITQLLAAGNEISLESLCVILTTVGKDLELHEENLDIYFATIKKLIENKPEISNLVKVKLQDLIKLQQNNWIPNDVDLSGTCVDKGEPCSVNELVPSTKMPDCTTNENKVDQYSTFKGTDMDQKCGTEPSSNNILKPEPSCSNDTLTLYVGSGSFEVPKGSDSSTPISNVILITKMAGEIIPLKPKTIQELADLKKQHPDSKLIINQ